MKSVLEALSRRVDCVVANPPYLGSSHFNDYMKDWIRGRYPDEKSDLCTCFIKRGFSLAKPNGYSSMVTMHSWMFIDSYKAMRTYILNNKSICSMAHLGTRAFEQIGGEVVQVAATVFLNGSSLANGVYFRLVDETSSKAKADRLASLVRDEAAIGRHCTNRDAFRAIPGCVIAYWCSETMLDTFRMGEKLSSYGTVLQQNRACH